MLFFASGCFHGRRCCLAVVFEVESFVIIRCMFVDEVSLRSGGEMADEA